MTKSSKAEKLLSAETSVIRLKEHLEKCSNEVRLTLNTLLREMSGSDWDNSQDISARGQSLASVLVSMRDDLDGFRRWVIEFATAIERMGQAASSFPPALSLKEVIYNIVDAHIRTNVFDFTLEEVSSDLEQLDVRLDVRNPAAVVASILARHPNVVRRAKGIYEIQVEEDVDEQHESLI